MSERQNYSTIVLNATDSQAGGAKVKRAHSTVRASFMSHEDGRRTFYFNFNPIMALWVPPAPAGQNWSQLEYALDVTSHTLPGGVNRTFFTGALFAVYFIKGSKRGLFLPSFGGATASTKLGPTTR